MYRDKKSAYPGVICGDRLKNWGIDFCFSLIFWSKQVGDEFSKKYTAGGRKRSKNNIWDFFEMK